MLLLLLGVNVVESKLPTLLLMLPPPPEAVVVAPLPLPPVDADEVNRSRLDVDVVKVRLMSDVAATAVPAAADPTEPA